jgi:hypothetical protein
MHWRVLRRIAHHPATLVVMVAAGTLIAAQELAWSALFHADQRLVDFRVFWCGGFVALARANPYSVQPILACEHRYATALLIGSPNVVMPFVLPTFDLVPLAALARLPFDVAARVFVALGAIAIAIGVVLVARTTRLPLLFCGAALAMSIGLPSLALGQIVPFEFLAVAATGALVAARRDRLAGACAALTLLEPHVGAFVVATLFVLAPQARLAVVAGTLTIGAAGLAIGGIAGAAAFLAALPAHAAAEAGYFEQYSLTYALTYAGVPTAAALAAGAASSAVMLIAGIVLARAFSVRGARAALIYLPAACAVAGGTFVHLTQVALAIPAALLLFAHTSRGTLERRLAAVALVLLAVPWAYPVLIKQALAPAMLVIGVLVWHYRPSYRWTVSVLAACWLVFSVIENHPPPAPPAPILAAAVATETASISWGAAVDQMTSHEARFLAAKCPSWLGLCATLVAAAMLGKFRRGVSASSAKMAA